MSSVEQQIVALQRRVSALERGRQQLSEQSTPNYLTTKPDGSVGALFTGGVQIPEQLLPGYNPGTALGFVDSTGVVREFILGLLAGQHELRLRSTADGPTGVGNIAELSLRSTPAGGVGSAQVVADALDSVGFAIVTVIDSAKRSNFAQLGAGVPILSTVGTGTLAWPAAGAFSNGLTIALPGAAGVVRAVATPTTNVTNPAFFDQASITGFPNGAGGVVFQAETIASGAPGAAGTMDFAFLMWGT